MNKTKFSSQLKLAALAAVSVFIPTNTQAQFVWISTADDAVWSAPSNWSPLGPPTAASNVFISSQPGTNDIGIDGVVTVASLTFNATLTNSVDLYTAGAGAEITINGGITNNDTATMNFALPVFAGATSTWDGPLAFQANVGIGTNQITLSDSINFTGSFLNFDLTNTTTYGRFLGSGTATVAGVTINLGGAYTGVLGNTFDLTSGNFSGATLGALPTLSSGLSWETSNFLANGTLTVIPEPNTWILIGIGLASFAFLRRRLA